MHKASKFHIYHQDAKKLLNSGRSIFMAATLLAFLSQIALGLTAFHFLKCDFCHLASGMTPHSFLSPAFIGNISDSHFDFLQFRG